MAPLIQFSGLASGIDSNGLIEAILQQQRKAQVDPLSAKVKDITATNDSFDELSSLLTKLNAAASKFRTINGSVLAKTALSSNESVATASATNSASNGTYSVTVSQLASAGTYSFADRFSDSTSIINSSINNGAASANRTVTVQVGTGSEQETVNIELTNTTTVGEFVNSFNAATDKAEAALVNVGTSSSPSYAVVITSLNQGTSKGQLGITVGSEIQTAGAGAFITASSTLNQAQDSQFTVSGIGGTITRSTNSVSDVVNGVQFNFVSTGTTTVSVSDDADTTKNSLREFVDAYNDIVRYVAENDAVIPEKNGSETVNIFGPLATTSVDESLLSSLRSAITSSGKTGGTVNIFADLGITTERDGTLKFDEAKFSQAVSSDPEGVRTITQNLGETLASVNGTIAQYTRFNGIIDIAQNTNKNEIETLESRITDLESQFSKQQETLISQFARLESLIGRLNSQQSALSSLLPR